MKRIALLRILGAVMILAPFAVAFISIASDKGAAAAAIVFGIAVGTPFLIYLIYCGLCLTFRE